MNLGVNVYIARSQGKNKKEMEVDDFALIYYGMVAINRFWGVPFSNLKLCQVWGCPMALQGEIVC